MGTSPSIGLFWKVSGKGILKFGFPYIKEPTMSTFIRRILVLAVLLMVIAAGAAFAQVGTSRITGSVTDASGAVIPGATVTAISEATGVAFTQPSTDGGLFSFPSLTAGVYTIKVELQGFKTAQVTGNILQVNTPLTVNVVLQVGGVNEIVNVEGGYEKLESSSAKIGNVVEQKAIESLPLNGRNPLSLITLEPGVVQRSYGGAGSGLHINGARDRAVNVTIDGIDANESSVPNPMSNVYRLNPDNVQEFRVVTSNATAEEGRNSGANMSIATRSGTNQYHGRAFEFFRNTALNSNEFYSNAQGKARPDIKLNQFGAEGGGPIIKGKTFFFASYQNQRIKTTQPIDQTFGNPTLYTPTALSGIYRYWIKDPTVPFNFSGQTITQNTPLLVDPSTGALKSGVPVCGGSVITNCVASYNIFANDPKGIGADAKIASLFKTYPLPNNYSIGDGLNTATYTWNPPANFEGPNYLGRVDHRFNENNNVFVRYMYAQYNTLQGDPLNARPMVFPGFPPLGEVFRTTQGLAASYRRVFSPTIVNEFTTGYSRFVYLFTQGEANPAWPNTLPYSFSNVTLPYLNTPRTYRAVTTPQFIDNLSIIKGKHVLQMGTNIRLYEHNDQRGQPGGINVTPYLYFSGTTRTPPGFTTPAVGTTSKAGIASTDNTRLLSAINELVGIPAQLSQTFLGEMTSDVFLPYKSGNAVTMWAEGHRLKQFNFYFQDEWKFRPNITINLGLRWEINKAPTEAGGRVYLPDKPVNGSQGAITFVKSDAWLKTNNAKAFAPRIAIAWSPLKKTVLRIGYGIYNDPLNSFMVTSVSGKIPGLTTSCSSVVGGATTTGCMTAPDLRINQGFPIELTPPTAKPSSYLTLPTSLYSNSPSLVSIDPYMKLPTVHQWNLGIQQELPAGFVAQVAYVGHRGTRLMRIYNINQISADPVIPSFLLMQKNYNAGCQPDGTGCPAGVTGTPLPIVGSGANQIPQSLVSTVINSSTTKGYLPQNNVGLFAQRIEQNTLNMKLRPNQQFSTISYIDTGGDSYYHGMQMTLRKRFEKGLLFGMAYTLAKSIDDQSIDPVGASSGGGYSTTASRYAVDIRNWRLERGRSDFDRRHVLNMTGMYELPIGRGKWLGSNFNGFLNQIFGGWSINGIYNWMSGEPFSVMSGVYTASNGHTSRAALVGALPKMELQDVPGVIGPVYFKDNTAFKYPDVGSIGMGRNMFEAQSYWNLDLGITKIFTVTERANVEFRMEMFNALNHSNFDNPRDASTGSPVYTSSLFAQACCSTVAPPSTQTIIQTGESGRVIQFALKVIF
jgi:hypothetical protein